MKKPFSGLFARAICHATEDLERVKVALATVVSDAAVRVSVSEGHHGNPITLLEAEADDPARAVDLLSALSQEDLKEILATLPSRVDDACNLFLRFDKQKAYMGVLSLSKGDDVVSVRIRVAAFPAKAEIAESLVRRFVEKLLRDRPPQAGEPTVSGPSIHYYKDDTSAD